MIALLAVIWWQAGGALLTEVGTIFQQPARPRLDRQASSPSSAR